jgi:hypothetical protein
MCKGQCVCKNDAVTTENLMTQIFIEDVCSNCESGQVTCSNCGGAESRDDI